MSRTFPVSFISEGKFFEFGKPIEDADIRPFMLRYVAKEMRQPKTKEVNLRRQYGQPYSVDSDGRMGHPVGRQIAEMEVANAEQEFAEDIASEPPDQSVHDALEQAQEEYSADIERQKLNARVAVERADEMNDAVRQEQDEAVESGEFDVMDSDLRSQPKPQYAKLFVKRGSRFVSALDAELIPGEKLFRFRKRSFGQDARYIAHSTVKNHE
jgi:hypothetical protein